MSKRPYSKVTSSKKRRKLQCLVCDRIFDDDYRKEHNLKYHEDMVLNRQQIWYQFAGAPANPFAAATTISKLKGPQTAGAENPDLGSDVENPAATTACVHQDITTKNIDAEVSQESESTDANKPDLPVFSGEISECSSLITGQDKSAKTQKRGDGVKKQFVKNAHQLPIDVGEAIHSGDTSACSSRDQSESIEEPLPVSTNKLPVDISKPGQPDSFDFSAPCSSSSNSCQNKAESIETGLLDKTKKWPTDPVRFQGKSFTPKFIAEVVAVGPCQPGIKGNFKFPVDERGRRFVPEWYYEKEASGFGEIKSYREWLSYSVEKNAMFCFPCILFANQHSQNFEDVWCNPSKGCTNFKKGKEKILSHEKSCFHIDAMKAYVICKYRLKQKTVIGEQDTAYQRQVEHNRKVLKRIIDGLLFCATQNLAIRGHREYARLGAKNFANEGNFLELLKLLARYDSILESHLSCESGKGMPKYLSPKIQNELLETLASSVTRKIVTELNDCGLFSLIIDSATDNEHTDQVSMNVRYVSASGDVEERFLGFNRLDERSTGQQLSELVTEVLEKQGIDIATCCGQSYDGAANMSGRLNGLQAHIKAKYAIYVHCCAHNLNLVLVDAATSCVEVKKFFGTLERVYTFITGSHNRTDVIEKKAEEMEIFSKRGNKLKVKQLSETRWASRNDAVKSIMKLYPAIRATLEYLSGNDPVAETCSVAEGLHTAISKFEFVLMLHFWSELLKKVKILSSYLQEEGMVIVRASELVQSTSKDIKKMRSEEEYTSFLDIAKAFARKHESAQEFQAKRQRKRKRMFDELASDEVITDESHRFKVETYYAVLDVMLNDMDKRFESFAETVLPFCCLHPKNVECKESLASFKQLLKNYDTLFETDSDIVSEFESFQSFWREINRDIKKNLKTTAAVLKFLTSYHLHNVFPHIFKLYQICVIIPSSSASAERSFSRMKLIKTYLRTTMSSERLSSLATLSIEREVALYLPYDDILDTFATSKKRMAKF